MDFLRVDFWDAIEVAWFGYWVSFLDPQYCLDKLDVIALSPPNSGGGEIQNLGSFIFHLHKVQQNLKGRCFRHIQISLGDQSHGRK
jgi:hypothetical protein